MPKSFALFLVVMLVQVRSVLGAQIIDSLNVQPTRFEHQLTYGNFVVSSSLILCGVMGTYVDPFRRWNVDLRDEVLWKSPRKLHFDDQLRYLPVVSVYLLNFVGVESKNRFVDRSIVIFSSYILTTVTVRALKSATGIMRPDSSLRTSFPSGHATLAFAGAEFLWQEYKHKSVWYGVAGYGLAGSVGVMRVINNRHWFADVLAGAGIGILCTKTAYIIYERVKPRFKNRKVETLVYPSYNGDGWGVSLAMRF